MLGLNGVLNMMGSAMSAESININLIASNLANAGSVGPNEKSVYRSKHPVFKTVTDAINGLNNADQPLGGVRVTDIQESKKPLEWRYEPDNPMANEEGKIFLADVNPIEEMSNMIAASKQYQAAVEVMKTTKSLLLKTIRAIDN